MHVEAWLKIKISRGKEKPSLHRIGAEEEPETRTGTPAPK